MLKLSSIQITICVLYNLRRLYRFNSNYIFCPTLYTPSYESRHLQTSIKHYDAACTKVFTYLLLTFTSSSNDQDGSFVTFSLSGQTCLCWYDYERSRNLGHLTVSYTLTVWVSLVWLERMKLFNIVNDLSRMFTCFSRLNRLRRLHASSKQDLNNDFGLILRTPTFSNPTLVLYFNHKIESVKFIKFCRRKT